MNDKFTINEKRIEIVLRNMKMFFSDWSDNIAQVDYPLEINYGSEKWIYYIFYSCLLDYGMRSKIYHQNLVRTYENYEYIFNPKIVTLEYGGNSFKREELLNILKDNVHPRYPNIALKKWLNLSFELAKIDNICDKIKSFKTFEELEFFVKNIGGFGQKTGGLLIRLLFEANVCGFSCDVKSIPLDRHDIKICYMCKIINKEKLSEKEIALLSSSLIKIGRRLGISSSDVDKYLWEIGNTFCNKKDCLSCPLFFKCNKPK